MKRSIFLLLLPLFSLGADIHDHLVPKRITIISSNDLAHSRAFYDTLSDCAYGIYARSRHQNFMWGFTATDANFPYTHAVGTEDRAKIELSGRTIRERVYSDTATAVISSAIARETYAPDALEIAADAIQDSGGELPEQDVLRNGVPAPDPSTPVLRSFERLFTLFKINDLPSLLFNRAVLNVSAITHPLTPNGPLTPRFESPTDWRMSSFPRADVYFAGAAFWGAALSLEELLQIGTAASRFRHMTLYLTADELVPALLLPEIEFLESLTIVLRNPEGGVAGEAEFPLVRSEQDLAQMRRSLSRVKRFAFNNLSNAAISAGQLVDLLDAAPLQSLLIQNISLSSASDQSHRALRGLKEFRAFNGLLDGFDPVDGPLRGLFEYLNPAVEHFELQQEGASIGPDPVVAALGFHPGFKALRSFRLSTYEALSAHAWKRLLSNDVTGPRGLFTHLDSFVVQTLAKRKLGKRTNDLLRGVVASYPHLGWSRDGDPNVVLSRK